MSERAKNKRAKNERAKNERAKGTARHGAARRGVVHKWICGQADGQESKRLASSPSTKPSAPTKPIVVRSLAQMFFKATFF